MSAMPAEKHATVTNVVYTKADDKDPNHLASAGPKVNGIPVLRITFEYDNQTFTQDVNNGEFQVSNPALQLLSYLGLKPSDLDGQYIEPTNASVPVVRTGKAVYRLHKDALEIGRQRLESADWGPMIDGDTGNTELNTLGDAEDRPVASITDSN